MIEQQQAETTFPPNPRHQVATCGRCGEEMIYNVPRLGAAGGFIHKESHSFLCADQNPIRQQFVQHDTP